MLKKPQSYSLESQLETPAAIRNAIDKASTPSNRNWNFSRLRLILPLTEPRSVPNMHKLG
jgi:hypothetical protein